MERKAFVFYRSFYEATSAFDDASFGNFMRAIVEYGLNGVIPADLTPMSQMAFTLIKPQIDANNTRYENGCKGGAPAGNQNARKQPKTTEKQPTVDLENNQETTENNQRLGEKQPKEKDKEKDKEKVKDNLSIETERDLLIKETFLFGKHLKNFRQEAQQFNDCYEATGWLNKNGVPIKSVSAAARMWQPKGKAFELDATLLGKFQQVYELGTMDQKKALLNNFLHIVRNTDQQGFAFIGIGYKDEAFKEAFRNIHTSHEDNWENIWGGEQVRLGKF